MKNENGINDGARNIGRFFLALIPWALAIGAMAWLAVWVSVAEYRRQVSQERRMATYVGAEERPKGKIILEDASTGCAHIKRAETDGDKLVIYGENRCRKRIDYLEYHWQSLSPDGTVIAQGYENGCPIPSVIGDVAECRMAISTDDRTQKLRIWVQNANY